jgi:hypothetical protein
VTVTVGANVWKVGAGATGVPGNGNGGMVGATGAGAGAGAGAAGALIWVTGSRVRAAVRSRIAAVRAWISVSILIGSVLSGLGWACKIPRNQVSHDVAHATIQSLRSLLQRPEHGRGDTHSNVCGLVFLGHLEILLR